MSETKRPQRETTIRKNSKRYARLAGRTQYIVAHFESGREQFLDYLESEGFKYENGFPREQLIESRYPIIAEISNKIIWGITSSAIAGVSVSVHISDPEFREFYEESSFYQG